ncbi:hypothetical protein Tco_0797088 [Tanacetum coccineum]
MIEKNVIESLEDAVLARSSSQPKSTYKAATSLSEFELTKILLDKMEESKSHLRADYKRKLYDALVESYNTDNDLFSTYGETEGRKERSQARKLSHPEIQGRRKRSLQAPLKTPPTLNIILLARNNDEQPIDKDVSKANYQVTRAKEPRTSFDELMDTLFDFSAFVLNWLNIKDLTQEILVGLAFELLKGTCKSLTELEYHLEECSKATTERLDWYNPEGKPYLFDLSKPLPLIPDHRGHQVIPEDYFINNDLNPVKVIYDKHAYCGTSHWGPKRQHFYGFTTNMTSSKDVYSRKRIIAVTRHKIIMKYDYGHLEEIEVRKED